MKDAEVRMFRSQMQLLHRRLRLERPPVPGLSRSMFQVLAAATRLPEGCQPSHLAESLQMTSSNVAAALRELEAAGFVRRDRDPRDARRVLVFVTPIGADAVQQLRSERDTWLGQAIQAMLSPQEQRELLAAGPLLERLSQYEPPTSESRGDAEIS